MMCLIFNIDYLTENAKREYNFVLTHVLEVIYVFFIVLLIFLLYKIDKNVSWPLIWLIDIATFVIIILVSNNSKTFLQMFPNYYIALTYLVLAAKHLLSSKNQKGM